MEVESTHLPIILGAMVIKVDGGRMDLEKKLLKEMIFFFSSVRRNEDKREKKVPTFTT